MSLSNSTTVCITGLGTVSCAGGDVESLWQAALNSRIAAQWWPEPIQGAHLACCRADTPTITGMRASDVARLDRFARLGVAAGQQAWEDAKLSMHGLDPRRIAVVSGTSRGPVAQRRESVSNRRRPRPTTAVYGSSSSLTGALAGLIGARGPSLTVSATCASSSVATGVAAMQITSGQCDVAVVGGADAPLHPEFLAELLATGVLGSGEHATRVCRPYDRQRTGIAIGEAGAYVVLESSAHAQSRGARVRAELIGWDSACDSGHRSGMSEDARGVQEALGGTLARAGVEVRDVDAVHVHGTGTPVGDAAEGTGLRQLLGRHADEVPFFSTKAITGHCLGASGALQTVINVRALEEQILPPTAGCERPDPDCRIELQTSCWRGRLRTILTHSAGFWGHHAGLLLRQA